MKTTKTLNMLPTGLLALVLTMQQLHASDSQAPTKSLGNLPPKIQQFLGTPNALIIAKDAIKDPRITALAPLAIYGASQVIKNRAMESRASSSLLTSLARQVDEYKWWILGGTATAGAYVLITRKNKAINKEKQYITDVNKQVLGFQSELETFRKDHKDISTSDIDNLLSIIRDSEQVANSCSMNYELLKKTIEIMKMMIEIKNLWYANQ